MTGPADTGPADTGSADTGSADPGSADPGSADTGSPDTGSPDTGSPDTGSPDTGPADVGSADVGPQRRRRRRKRALAETAITVLVAALVAVLLRGFAFQTFWIPSASMVPTLGVHDRVLVQKAFFTWHDVRQGDIVVFRHPPLDHCLGPRNDNLVKRVIALPGQTIYSSSTSVYVNGRRLAEPYIPHDDPLGLPIPVGSRQHPYRLPAGEFYVLGDDRSVSCDSRYWGPLQGSSIVGKVVLVWWHNGGPYFRPF